MIYGLIAVLVLVGFLVMSILRVSGNISEEERAREDAEKYKREDD
jgi:hypothetical protein